MPHNDVLGNTHTHKKKTHNYHAAPELCHTGLKFMAFQFKWNIRYLDFTSFSLVLFPPPHPPPKKEKRVWFHINFQSGTPALPPQWFTGWQVVKFLDSVFLLLLFLSCQLQSSQDKSFIQLLHTRSKCTSLRTFLQILWFLDAVLWRGPSQ